MLGVTGCCFELAFVATVTWVVSSLQMTFAKKAIVVCLFATRLPCVASLGA